MYTPACLDVLYLSISLKNPFPNIMICVANVFRMISVAAVLTTANDINLILCFH